MIIETENGKQIEDNDGSFIADSSDRKFLLSHALGGMGGPIFYYKHNAKFLFISFYDIREAQFYIFIILLMTSFIILGLILKRPKTETEITGK